jgi:hypothetical protein
VHGQAREHDIDAIPGSPPAAGTQLCAALPAPDRRLPLISRAALS